MTTATWNGTVIAESDDIVTVEAPPPRVPARRRPAALGHAHVVPLEGHGLLLQPRDRRPDQPRRRLVLPEPKDAAKEITDRVAFWKGVEVR